MKIKLYILVLLFVVSANNLLSQKRQHFKLDSTRYMVLIIDALKSEYLEKNEEAILLYNTILNEFPKSAAAHYGLAALQTKLQRFDDAEKNLNAAFNFSGNEWYLRELVLFYEKLENRKLLLNSAVKLYKLFKTEENLLVLSKAYYLNGKPEKSYKLLQTVKEESMYYEEAFNLVLTMGTEQKNDDWVVFALKKLIAAFPYELGYKGMLAEFYLNSKAYDKAFSVYKDIIAIHPGEVKVKFSLLSYYIQTDSVKQAVTILNELVQQQGYHVEMYNVFYNLMYGYLGSMPLQTRLDLLERRINFYPFNKELNFMAFDVFNKTNRVEAQFNLLSNLYENGLSDFDLLRKYALLLAEKSDYLKLLAVSAKGIEIFPNNPDFYLYKGIANLELKQPADAYFTFQQGIDVVVENNSLLEQFYVYSAEALYMMNRYTECFDSFEKAIRLNAENLVVLNNYSYYIVQSKSVDDYGRALKMIEYCVNLQPNSINFLDTYAVVLSANNMHTEALQVISRALKVGGNLNPVVIEHKGDILLALGRVEEALREWKIALKLSPESESLTNKIKMYEK